MTRWSAVMVLCDHENKTLILKRGMGAPYQPGKWSLPGGIGEHHETYKDCAIRELQEETGIILPHETDVIYTHSTIHSGWAVHFFIAYLRTQPIVLLGETKNEKGIMIKENDEYLWASITELRQLENRMIPNLLLDLIRAKNMTYQPTLIHPIMVADTIMALPHIKKAHLERGLYLLNEHQLFYGEYFMEFKQRSRSKVRWSVAIMSGLKIDDVIIRLTAHSPRVDIKYLLICSTWNIGESVDGSTLPEILYHYDTYYFDGSG